MKQIRETLKPVNVLRDRDESWNMVLNVSPSRGGDMVVSRYSVIAFVIARAGQEIKTSPRYKVVK